MKKLIIAFIFTSAYCLYTTTTEESSSLCSSNVEALCQGPEDGDVVHSWCCGKTRNCLIHPDFIIKGKRRNTPCEEN